MPAMWNEAERVRVEEARPDHSEREDFLLLPSFFGDSVGEGGLTEQEILAEGDTWVEKYISDVQQVQMTRQHHIHPRDKQEKRGGHWQGAGKAKTKASEVLDILWSHS